MATTAQRRKTKTVLVDESEVNLTESPVSLKKKAERAEQPDVDKPKGRTAMVRATATRLGFHGQDGGVRVRPGATISFEAPLDEENRPILPTWLVLEKDYVPEEEPELPPGMKKVRGGVTQGGLKL